VVPSPTAADRQNGDCLDKINLEKNSFNAPLLSHLITLSARASRFGGIVRPICLAVFRLILNSKLVGRSTGNSPAFAPLRILPIRRAASCATCVSLAP
jgi:hypothetical protein